MANSLFSFPLNVEKNQNSNSLFLKVQLGIAFDIHLEDVKMITLFSRGDLDHLIAFQNKGIDSMIRREKMVMTLPLRSSPK